MDAAVIKVSVVDAVGRIVPTAGNKLEYDITGVGKLIGLANGDPSSP
jgi:beta-galactosidase